MNIKKNHHKIDENGFPTDPLHHWNWDRSNLNKQKKEFLRREFKSAETAYDGGNVGVLFDVLALCKQFEVPLPDWAVKAFMNLLVEKISGDSKGIRGQKKWINHYLDDMKDYQRYLTVLEFRERGIRWLDVYDDASKYLKGTFAKGGSDTMEAAYKRVTKRLKTNPTRYKILSGIRIPK